MQDFMKRFNLRVITLFVLFQGFILCYVINKANDFRESNHLNFIDEPIWLAYTSLGDLYFNTDFRSNDWVSFLSYDQPNGFKCLFKGLNFTWKKYLET